jgi:hypothetical protein
MPVSAIADQWIQCKGDHAVCRYNEHHRLHCPTIGRSFADVYVISDDILKHYESGYLNPVSDQAIETTDDMYILASHKTSLSMNRKNGDFLRADRVRRGRVMYRGNCSATEPKPVSIENRF